MNLMYKHPVNVFFHQKIYYCTAMHMLQNHWVGYLGTTMRNLCVSQYCHDNTDKDFENFYNYLKTIHGENLTYFPQNMYDSKTNITFIFLTKLSKKGTYIYQIFIIIISFIIWLVLYLRFQRPTIFKNW